MKYILMRKPDFVAKKEICLLILTFVLQRCSIAAGGVLDSPWPVRWTTIWGAYTISKSSQSAFNIVHNLDCYLSRKTQSLLFILISVLSF